MSAGRRRSRSSRWPSESRPRRIGLAHRPYPYEQAYGKDFEDIRFRVPDTTKLRGAIGFRPTMSLDQILDAVIAYQKGRSAR